ncbi:MAG: hypothetical protein AB7O74_16425 [Candidatus Nanopelagicales bacterium]
MTTTLERPPTPLPPVSVARTSRLAQWWGQWRVALRLARRDAWRGKGRSILVLLLVGLPVLGVSVFDIAARQMQQNSSSASMALGRLGVADAMVMPQTASPVIQSAFAETTSGRSQSGPAPTLAELQAALPDGSRLVAAPPYAAGEVILEAGPWGLPAGLTVGDVSDPLLAGLWRLEAGTFPRQKGQITLDPGTARRLHVGIGDTVQLSGLRAQKGLTRSLVVVGLAEANPVISTVGVVAAGEIPVEADADPAPALARFYLVDSPTPITWADVRRLNAIGAFVNSRYVDENPPTFCKPSELCLDDGPSPGQDVAEPELTPSQAEEVARNAALGAVIVVLVVLQIALLAGPAFAVQLRRRQRELGLIGAAGAHAPVLHRTVLASGVVLGVVASIGGAVLGWVVVLLLSRRFTDFKVNGFTDPGLPPVPPELAGVVAVGVIAAVSAALIPALAAGKGEVVDTLRGRRPLPRIRTRAPFLGLAMGLVGLLVMAYGVMQLDSLVLAVGVVVAQLGVVVLMPWLVVQTGRLGRFLPLAPRLAVRDAGRHRMRTAAAACAIAAASAAAVGVSAAFGSAATYRATTDVVLLPDVVPVTIDAIGFDENGKPEGIPTAQVLADARAAVKAADPGASTAFVAAVTPAGAPDAYYTGSGGVACGATPEGLADYDSSSAAPAPPCWGRVTNGYFPIASVIGAIEPDDVDLVLGPGAPLDEARAALAAGKAVVLQPGAVTDGEVVLRSWTYDPSTGMEKDVATVTVPALEVLTGALPVNVLVSPETLARPGMAKAFGVGTSGVLLAKGSSPDTGDRPTFAERVQLELYRGEVPAATTEIFTSADPIVAILLVGGGVTALLALLAGLMVTALALADGKADHATLAAVGAPPGTRRRLGAATAGYVALLGCTVGVVSGLLGSYVLVPLLNRGISGTWVTPWAMITIVLVGVPLLTSVAAWLTTRSSVPLTRRTDT